jgi:membrane associated rhomboid family serine protease
MLPLSDANPKLTPSVVTTALLLLTIAIFFVYQSGDVEATSFASSAIACELSTGEPVSLAEVQSQSCALGGSPLYPNKILPLSVLASVFLHSSLLHLLGNMWVLRIFGDNMEDAFGHLAFLLFYLMAGAVAVLGFVALNPTFTGPLVGASGAVAGVLGAYVVLFPTKKVRVLLWLFPLRLSAWVFLGAWFGSQFLIGSGTIAWEAHIAGFLFGATVAVLLRGQASSRLAGLTAESQTGLEQVGR